MLESFIDWFMGLGEEYGVNPIIFGSIYVGAIPFFTASLGWLIRNIRKKKPIVIPTLLSGFFFISAYLYLMIAGENIPTMGIRSRSRPHCIRRLLHRPKKYAPKPPLTQRQEPPTPNPKPETSSPNGLRLRRYRHRRRSRRPHCFWYCCKLRSENAHDRTPSPRWGL